MINTNFTKWTKEVTPIAFIQKKIGEFNTITYKNPFPIFSDGSKINEKVTSRAFLPLLNSVMGKRMYDSVSMSADLYSIIMALEHLKNNQPLTPNLQNIIDYFDSVKARPSTLSFSV